MEESTEPAVAANEIYFSVQEAAYVSKKSNGDFILLGPKDAEVKAGTHGSYSTKMKEKIQEKFNLVAKVRNGKKQKGDSLIVYMACPHLKIINVSMPMRLFLPDKALIFKVRMPDCDICMKGKPVYNFSN